MEENQLYSKVHITLTDIASDKILHHIFSTPNYECGGYLVGVVTEQDNNISILLGDVYIIDKIGTNASFKFSPQSGLDAYNYCIKCNAVNLTDYKIIGNYHSHGKFQAFFSDVDEVMMRQSAAPEVYMVFSPSSYEFTALYKDKFFRLYMVDCDFDMPGFNYISPYLNSKVGWKLYNTDVDFKTLSRVINKGNDIPQLSSSLSKELSIQSCDIVKKERIVKDFYDYFKRLYAELQSCPKTIGMFDFKSKRILTDISDRAKAGIKDLRKLMISLGCLLSDNIDSNYIKCENIFLEIEDEINSIY